MPRPRKCRKVCQLPFVQEFRPVGPPNQRQSAVILTVDEYEAIRLIDKQGFSQEECSNYMHIARTTAQAIYNSARKKIAKALIDGLPLRIEGGDYQLCDGKEDYCDCGGCQKHRYRYKLINKKEDHSLKIAIPLDENQQDVCIVLSRAPFFLFWEDGKEHIVENPAAQVEGGAGIKAAQFLVDNKVNVIITVRCGENAAEVFQAADIKIYHSVNKAAADDLAAFADEKLEVLTHFHGGYHGIQ